MTAPQTEATTDPQGMIAALQQKLDAALSEKAALAEALATRNSEFGERIEQQSATIDVLKVMSASSGDPLPVFDLIVRRAQELCNSKAAGIYEYDGELVHLRAHYGDRDIAGHATYFAAFPMMPFRGSIPCRAILDKQVVHIPDTGAEPELLPIVGDLGIRSVLAIPLLRDGAAIGAFTINSIELGGFSDSQVALSQTFAEQAVISLTSAETYRALQTRTSDLQETLEYQTAISDVLKVISRSAFDLQPVLETVVQKAVRLCDADFGAISLREGDILRVGAAFSKSPEFLALMRGLVLTVDRGSLAGRAVVERRIVFMADGATDPGFTLHAARQAGMGRSGLGVPLFREGEVVGAMAILRQRVEPFTDRQIALVSTFADRGGMEAMP